MAPTIQWPGGKRFAFTVFDDTDRATVENVAPVYALLRDLGFRTTKSVWPLGGTREPADVGGATCEDPAYLAWVQGLQREGFEIGYHNATFHSSPREDTERGLERFATLFGGYPRAMANHTSCREGIYWGPDRLGGARRLAYQLLTRGRHAGWFRGHVPGDRFFWGDLCRERVTYVRNFTFADVNTLEACPEMPYHDPARPFVNAWYACSEGGDVDRYCATLSPANQDRLEEEGGACLMYTHFGKRFTNGGRVDPRFRALMTRLAAKGGWFVPISELLDHLRAQRGAHHTLTPAERARLERRWLVHKLVEGSS